MSVKVLDRVIETRLDSLAKRKFGMSRTAFAGIVFLAELLFIIAIAVATGIVYHMQAYGAVWDMEQYAAIGGLTGLAFGLPFLMQDDYSVESVLEGRRTNGRLFLAWNVAFAALAVIGFLTKTSAVFSRGWLILFYCAGLVTIIALNAAVHRSIGSMIERRLIRPRRLMLVGTAEELARMEREIADGAAGAQIVARLPVTEELLDDHQMDLRLDAALLSARTLGIEDVIISGAHYRGDFIEKAIASFSLLPVVIHLGAGGLIQRFKHARVARFGRTMTLSLTREPIGPFPALAKRGLDLVLALVAVVLLAPLFAVVAALIKFDSKGPVFFRQRRRGYNLAEFRMWKFRTMTTLDDGDVVKQATEGDARVTRIGRLLRKYSIDELPQLFNVIAGDMSLVGPRPHAVAHDRFFEKRIQMYPRRLNVKPGITGWAQVNGFRGATDTDYAMQQRVEHDLYYIDNWSLMLDLYIIVLTVISPRTMRNAY